MKKRYESDYFKARYIGGSGEMAKHCDTIEDMREAIDDANARSVSMGYKAEQYLITHLEWYTYLDDNGQFAKREEYESAIEVYPETLG